MKIDISKLNKESFISVLTEEIERQTENQRSSCSDNRRKDWTKLPKYRSSSQSTSF